MSTLIAPTPEDLLLHNLLEQRKESSPAAGISQELEERVQAEIKVTLDSFTDDSLVELLRFTFDVILLVFDRLSLIESNLQKLDTLQENLSIMEVLQFEIRYLIEFVETEAMSAPGLDDRLRETFDGIAYGMSHDVKRVFERELAGDLKTQTIPVVFGKLLHSHGLLRNCFQQTLITLLQAFNPKLDPIRLFNDFEERLRQSLLLCNELAALMRVVKIAQTQRSAEALHAVIGKAIEFRDGPMQYLMYRDWRGYEHHALALITSIEGNFDSWDLLHQFGCYLEVLYGHVKMRSVLREMFPNEESGE